VGGTILDADAQTGAYHSETTWNEPDFADASGGGLSAVYGPPAYQAGLNLASRGVPDVAYNAAILGGVLAVWSTSGQGANLVFQFGGTSAGAPQWAGLVALAVQAAGHRIGQLNPVLYADAQQSPGEYAALFHDITTGDNTFHGPVTIDGYSAGAGYDLATGLGSPKAQNLVPALVTPATTTTLAANPSTAAVNEPISFTATVQPSGDHQPTGSVSFYLDGAATPAATVALTGERAAWQTTLGFGTHSVVATYSGDTFNAASTSDAATVTVGGCTTTITGNYASLSVSSGVTCIGNATITGGIVVASGATLDLENATVQGGITAYRPVAVRVCGSSTGSITVAHASGAVIVGDPSNGCSGNVVSGSLSATGNQGGGSVSGNTISGSWTVAANNPAFTVIGNHH
jgi:subtilase family serine protease